MTSAFMGLSDSQELSCPPEKFELMLIEEERVSPALDSAIRSLLCHCFPYDAAVFSRSRHWHGSEPLYSLLYQREGLVLGHVGVVVREILAGNVRVTVGGIQNLAVSPDFRSTGVGRHLMIEAMEEARRRSIPFGLLFCAPTLEKFYRAIGWDRLDAKARMNDQKGQLVPIPDKNICMMKSLGEVPFPDGELDLSGADW